MANKQLTKMCALYLAEKQQADTERDALKAENERLREVIERVATAWLSLDLGIWWEGDIGGAMVAAVAEIERLRGELAAALKSVDANWIRHQQIVAERQRSRLPPELVARIRDGIFWIGHDDIDDLLRDILAALEAKE